MGRSVLSSQVDSKLDPSTACGRAPRATARTRWDLMCFSSRRLREHQHQGMLCKQKDSLAAIKAKKYMFSTMLPVSNNEAKTILKLNNDLNGNRETTAKINPKTRRWGVRTSSCSLPKFVWLAMMDRVRASTGKSVWASLQNYRLKLISSTFPPHASVEERDKPRNNLKFGFIAVCRHSFRQMKEIWSLLWRSRSGWHQTVRKVIQPCRM